jgi:PAS domain S-box-containing protein
LLLGLLLSFLIVFGGTCIVAYQSYTKAIDATIRSNETRATLLSKLILEHQRAAIGVLQSYADRPLLKDSIKKRNFEGTRRHLIDLVKHNPEMDWPFLSNPDSTVWVNYPVDRQVMNKDLSYRDWYKGVSKEWKPYISSVYKLIVGKKDLAVAVSAPIFDQKGKVIGILSTAQSTAFFKKIISDVGLNVDAKITLIDQEGHIIYSNGSPEAKDIVAYPSLELVRKATTGEKGNGEVSDAPEKGGINYVSFAPIEGIGWSIIVEKRKSEVLRSETSHFVLIGVIALLIYGFAALSLVHLTQRHSQVKELKRLTEDLDGQVRERTAALENANRELRDHEERARTFAEATFEGISISEADRYLDCNEQFERITGYSRSDLATKQVGFLFPADERERILDIIRRGEERTTEYELTRKDGSQITVEVHGKTVHRKDGPPRRYSVMRDITDRKRAEKALQQSEEEYRHLVEHAPTGIYEIEYAGPRFKRVNDAMCSILGYTRKELLATNPLDLMDSESQARFRKRIREVLACEKIDESVAFRVFARDGREIWAALNVKLTYRDGRPDGALVVAHDITDRKRAEEALRQSEARYRMLHETLRDAFVQVTMEGRIVEFNDMYCQMLGYSRDELHALTSQELTPECWHAVEESIVQDQIISRGYSDVYEKEYRRKDGTIIPVELRTILTRDEAGRPSAMWGIIREITERKRTEEVLRRRTSELQHLTQTLEERVKERTAELKALSSELLISQEKERRRISQDLHDNIWQTLETIKFKIEALCAWQDGGRSEMCRQKSKEITAAISSTVATIRSMQGDLWPSVLDDLGIIATMKWYCSEFEKNSPEISIEQNIRLVENEVPRLVKIVAYRVMREAMENAAKHGQATRITLSLTKTEHLLEVRIEDNGTGFNPENIINRSPWAGLGVVSMRERTEHSGGSFAIESAEGKGTTVCVSWPLTPNS